MEYIEKDDSGDWDLDYEEPYCWRCDNSGWVVICIDDLCRNSGGEPGERCIHGDGDVLCPECKGRNAY